MADEPYDDDTTPATTPAASPIEPVVHPILTDTQQQITQPILPEIELKSTPMLTNQFPQVPISHLMATNNYPSLNTVPPNIAKSFAPVFVQPPNQQADSDIYNDYVQNPYNLTLLRSDNHNDKMIENNTKDVIATADDDSTDITNESVISPHLTPKQLGASNIFQSSNYFNTDGIIPPGSEMLFGGP